MPFSFTVFIPPKSVERVLREPAHPSNLKSLVTFELKTIVNLLIKNCRNRPMCFSYAILSAILILIRIDQICRNKLFIKICVFSSDFPNIWITFHNPTSTPPPQPPHILTNVCDAVGASHFASLRRGRIGHYETPAQESVYR